MPSRTRLPVRFQPSLAFVLLTMLLATLWLAGGASRGDVLGQVVVRAVAWGTMIVFFLFGERTSSVSRPIRLLAGAALLLVLVQLIPLPPVLWQALPGRALLSQAATLAGESQPWRTISIVPEATMNAAASLVVPFAILLIVSGLRETERRWLPGMVLMLVVLSSLIGLIQFAGITINNPFVNDSMGMVDGTFANRNHFAVLIAFGCVIAPAWAFPASRAAGWRAPVGIGLVLLFALTILASGSRAGILIGFVAIVLGLVPARSGIRRTLARYPRWVSWVLVAGILVAVASTVWFSVAAGRAISIDRALGDDAGQDMRIRGLPVIWAMIDDYFPWGSGLGAFEPVFRVNEPFALLKPTYFNHAHNDWLEIIIDAGLPGVLLLVAAVAWWTWASFQAWWTLRQRQEVAARLGSAMLLLVMIASMFDYPARTPMIMAMVVLAAIWLSDHRGTSALPAASQHL